ncbi:transposase [Candidatus Bipolaricaulota bacterium]|nr:transposase [Candidatus Bipolaricaulota bacterium]
MDKLCQEKYVLQTSLSSKEYSPEKVDKVYRYLQKVERAFRHIKSYLKIRPIYHYKRRRALHSNCAGHAQLLCMAGQA